MTVAAQTAIDTYHHTRGNWWKEITFSRVYHSTPASNQQSLHRVKDTQ